MQQHHRRESGLLRRAAGGVDNIVEVVSQSVDIMAAQSVDPSPKRWLGANGNRFVRVEPKIYDVGLFEIGRIKECIDRGYSAMRKCLPAMRRATLQALRQDTLIGS